jgi:hypothetical protein
VEKRVLQRSLVYNVVNYYLSILLVWVIQPSIRHFYRV